MNIRKMTINDYEQVCSLWIGTPNMGLNNIDDSKEGIAKAILVVMAKNKDGNAFWEKIGFTAREDLTYRNKRIIELVRFDT